MIWLRAKAVNQIISANEWHLRNGINI